MNEPVIVCPKCREEIKLTELTGSAGFELIVSPKTGKAAPYGYYGVGLSFGSTSSSGGIGANLGLVFNCPTSQAYTENFISLTIPMGALPPKIRLHLVEGIGRMDFVAIQNSVPTGFGTLLFPVIGLAASVTRPPGASQSPFSILRVSLMPLVHPSDWVHPYQSGRKAAIGP